MVPMDIKAELSLRELMQMFHDMEEMEKDFDMLTAFMTVEELKTIQKNERHE
jgi:hypothetical protein